MTVVPAQEQSKRRLTKSRLLAALVATSLAALVAFSWSYYFHRSDDDNDSEKTTTNNHLQLLPIFPSVSKFSADDYERVLNVHVVPHTHDDVGWRKTVEQYYYGGNNSIDERGAVHSIISTVVESLTENPARTFTYVEAKFFSMWWNEQGDAVKDSVRYLIANQQLSFVNGGWCMHDEATTHYMGMIDQTTLGHRFLLNELGVVPTVGWQLDPFGHSATQASLLTSRAGFDALYFGRIDYQDLALRQETSECEGVWESSSNLDNSDIFWGLTGSYHGNYGAPEGFCFDKFCNDEPLVGANATRLMERLNMFLEAIRTQSDQTQGHNIMLTMGSDFQFMEAHVNFANLDLLIGSLMNYQRWGLIDSSDIFGPRFDRINIFYSTPDYYTKMKYQETVKATKTTGLETPVLWSVKQDDFFPYSDCAHCFWTGYFTSRTAFKRLERVASSFLLAARQIESMPTRTHTAVMKGSEEQPLYELDDALGVVQHHDAVSGTAKQHVADDYSKRVQAGVNIAADYVAAKLKTIMLNDPDTALTDLSYCQLLNETICDVSERATISNDTDVYAIIYNPLASNRSAIIRLPVSSHSLYRVHRIENDASASQVIRSSAVPELLLGGATKWLLVFDTGVLPPVGAVAFRISKAGDPAEYDGPSLPTQAETSLARRLLWDESESNVEISNGLLNVTFDSSTGMIRRISTTDVDLEVNQQWGYYTSFDSAFDRSEDGTSRNSQNSGAYVFRPNTPEKNFHPVHPMAKKAVFVNSSVGTDVHVSFDKPWIRQVTRLIVGKPYVEIEYTVGPIPISYGRGKEIATKFWTPIKSNGVFYTDSNGREFLQRKRNHRPSWNLTVYEPVAGNYYPVNAAMYTEDANASFAVLVDRSQGGGSVSEGQVEIMVQRRTVADDSRGVDEALNETTGGMSPYPPYGDRSRHGDGVIVRGTQRIMIGPGSSGASLARSEMDRTFAEPLVFVGSAPNATPVSFLQASFTGLQTALPSNVMLVTLTLIADREEPTFLLRLGHQYAVGEDAKLSAPVDVDLSKVLNAANFKVTAVKEKTLTGNQDWEVYQKRRFAWSSDKEETSETAVPLTRDSRSPFETIVTLKPMEIRTFELTVASTS